MLTTEKKLRELADPAYRDFQKRLVPTVAENSVLGVRIPDIRRLAKELSAEERAEFLSDIPHRFYDENILHSAILCNIRVYSEAVFETERFLPFVDNWAVCDTLSPKCFSKHRAELIQNIKSWIDSGETYTVRFGLGMLMRHYLDDGFRPEYLDWAAGIKTEEYYVSMMIAWYFATALAKQYDFAVKFIEEHRLDRLTNNRTIQKAVESFRITDERKQYLKSFKL